LLENIFNVAVTRRKRSDLGAGLTLYKAVLDSSDAMRGRKKGSPERLDLSFIGRWSSSRKDSPPSSFCTNALLAETKYVCDAMKRGIMMTRTTAVP
jgi:hypothetical protein